MNEPESKTRRGIQSIEIAGRILRVLAEASRPMMLKELSSATELSSAQLHGYLVSLKVTGLVDQDEGNGRYQLGHFALTLGIARMRSFDPLRHANLVGSELAIEINSLITVSVWNRTKPVIVQVHRGTADIHVQLQPGSASQLLNSAAGQLFAALLPRATTDPLLESELLKGYRSTSARKSITTIAEWENVAARIRERGYSVMVNSPFEGLNAASCPVFDNEGNLQFTMTAIGLSSEFSVGEHDERLRMLISTCEMMSKEMGYSKP
ncbi:IclR family transcriptional regulator [Rhizobium sp. Root1204]|uniref:IclR family transcriptional regulator n=1 Tax=Rhizobium sp. Root1204 TaxID=1736428 RepID=UPI000B004598|nr:IclR family transcriptional regulator [Rhizobium sp. Root1204]